MQNVTDVIIVGQGVVGLSAGIAMQNFGFQVTILDASPAVDTKKPPISRVYAINPSSINLFKKLNVWQHMESAKIATYNRMFVWESKQNSTIEFDSRLIAKDKLGVMLEELTLKSALLKQAKLQNIKLLNNYNVSSVTENTNDIIVSNEKAEIWRAQLLIIADGAKSSLREKLGIKITTWPYNQSAIVANVHTAKSHANTAYQVFTADGPLAFLPMADPNKSSIVWSTTSAKAQDLINSSNAEFTKALNTTFENKLGEIRLESPTFKFPLHMRHTQQYSGKRWILMGDAAHTIHPLAGLGLNLGLDDLETWMGLLQKNNLKLTSTKTLNTYQRSRKHALWQVIALMQALHVLFTNNLSPISKLASFGLSIVNNLRPLKKLIIQYASGSTISVK